MINGNAILKILTFVLDWIERRRKQKITSQRQEASDAIRKDPKRSFVDKFGGGLHDDPATPTDPTARARPRRDD